MIIGYIRVSSEKQTVENQRFEINRYAESQHIKIDKWVEETISTRKELKRRQLGLLLPTLQKGDMLLISEISRLGRNLYELTEILNMGITVGFQIISIKENYVFKDDIQSKIMAFTFGIAAEIERTHISNRTKTSLDKLKASGKHLGRPFGSKSKMLKLSHNINRIKNLMNKNIPKAQIAKILNVDKTTLYRFLKRNPII